MSSPRVVTHVSLQLGVPQKQYADSYTIYAEELVQIHVNLMLATSVSLNPYVPCLIDLVGPVLLVSSTLPYS